MTVKLLAFAASTRRDSFNRKLIAVAAQQAQALGAELTLIDLKDFPLPLYEGDLEAEQGMPASAQALLELLAAHDGLLLCTPEYNGFFPPLLKNTLDWMSRPEPSGQSGLRHFKGKTAALLAASPGAAGGLRSLIVTRQYLGNLGLLVIPAQFGLGSAGQAFDEEGLLKDSRQLESVKSVLGQLIDITRRLKV